jgi:hypothetical protein
MKVPAAASARSRPPTSSLGDSGLKDALAIQVLDRSIAPRQRPALVVVQRCGPGDETRGMAFLFCFLRGVERQQQCVPISWSLRWRIHQLSRPPAPRPDDPAHDPRRLAIQPKAMMPRAGTPQFDQDVPTFEEARCVEEAFRSRLTIYSAVADADQHLQQRLKREYEGRVGKKSITVYSRFPSGVVSVAGQAQHSGSK